MVIVAGLTVAWSGQQAALATAVVPTAVYFSFAMAGLEVAWLVATAFMWYLLFHFPGRCFPCGRRHVVSPSTHLGLIFSYRKHEIMFMHPLPWLGWRGLSWWRQLMWNPLVHSCWRCFAGGQRRVVPHVGASLSGDNLCIVESRYVRPRTCW